MRSYVFILDHWSGQVLDMDQPVDAFVSAGILYVFMLFATSPVLIICYIVEPSIWRSIGLWFLFNTLFSKEYIIWRSFNYSKKAKVGIGNLLFIKLISSTVLVMIFISSLVLIVSNKPNIYVLFGVVVFSSMYITTGKAVKLYRSK